MNNSAIRTLTILEYVAESKKPVTLSELSRELAIPKTSAFDIVQILLEKGFLETDNHDPKAYRLGLRAFQVGSAYINNTDLCRTARPFLERLKSETGETVYLAVESNGRIVYLDKVESDFPIRSIMNIGSSNAMHLTGLGKALLAAYPEQKVRKITGGGKLQTRTPHTIGDYGSLLGHLKAIREDGYSFDNGEDTELVRCMAAPVYDSTSNPVAAVSISMLAANLTPEKKEHFSKCVIKTALAISGKLGYPRSSLY